MRRHATWLACSMLVALTSALLASCGDATPSTSDDAPSNGPTTPATDTSMPSSIGLTASTTTVASTTIDAPAACGIVVEVSGRFDTDTTLDTAQYDAASSQLVVCTATRTFVIPASGSGELLAAADLDGDGVDEILIGGTTAWGVGVDVATIAGGALDYVRTPDGEVLSLWHGLPPDRFLTYGCADFDGDGAKDVAIVEGSIQSANEASWERRIYAIDGHQAIVVATDSGIFDPSTAPDPLTTEDIVSIRGADCRAHE